MPNIPGLPPDLAALPGVSMTPPPVSILRDVGRLLDEAVKELEPGEKGRLAWIYTTKGVNLAVVARVADGDSVKADVSGWIAKSWGEPISAGIAGRISWR